MSALLFSASDRSRQRASLLRVGALLCVVLAIFVPAPVVAPAVAQEEAAPVLRQPPPGYEKELLRLSEVLGSLAFLRTLCNADDAQQWRERMAALMESEARDAEGRARIAGAFNQGYRAFSVTYRTCTLAAREAITRYLAEGERLTRAIAGRFGG